jgi:hypothetical protein
MATNNTLPHPLDGIPEGEYQQWLNDPCTIAVKAAIEGDMRFAASAMVDHCSLLGDPDMAFIRAMGAQHKARADLLELIFGRSVQ